MYLMSTILTQNYNISIINAFVSLVLGQYCLCSLRKKHLNVQQKLDQRRGDVLVKKSFFLGDMKPRQVFTLTVGGSSGGSG